jgi:hypothetical protein
MLNILKDISDDMRQTGYSFVRGSEFSLTGNFFEVYVLSRSFENMGIDRYFGNEGRARRFRRYSDLNYNPVMRKLSRLPHHAYFQSEQMNKYVGGKERHFEDLSQEIIDSPLIQSLVNLDFEVFKSTLPQEMWTLNWQCQIHQIRIEVEAGEETEITPEGIHSDGYPFSAVHFWGKENIDGATSFLYTTEEKELISVTYENILDTTFFKDREMKHYVSRAMTKDHEKQGYRQIIAISFSIPGGAYDTNH